MKTNKSLFSFLLLCFLLASINTQAQDYHWTAVQTGPNQVFPTDVLADSAGNVYTIGFFSGDADFDPGPGTTTLSAFGAFDIFIQKLDSTGALIWARRIGHALSDSPATIEMDANNNLYIVGSFQGTVDFDPGSGVSSLVSNGGRDCFVLKLDANANFQWARSFGANASDVATGVAVDASGGVYVTGSFGNIVDFDPSPTNTVNLSSAGSRDVFVVKLDAQGNYNWAYRMGSTDLDFSGRCHLDAQGDLYVTGSFSDTIDVDPGAGISNLISNGGEDFFVQKLNPNTPTLIWARSFGGPIDDPFHDSHLAPDGTIYITGSFRTNIDLDPGPGVDFYIDNGSNDVFINVLDANGNQKWGTAYGAVNEDEGYGITADAQGNVYTIGYFSQLVDFDPGPGTFTLNGGGSDIFVQKLDSTGQFVWAYEIGFSPSEIGEGITADPYGNVFLTGYFRGPVDFDPGPGVDNLSPIGNPGGFTSRLRSEFVCSPSFSNITAAACNSYQSPAGNTYTQSGTYLDTLTNTCGADSIITINLTINQPTTFSETVASCVNYQWQGQTFTASGTYQDTLQNAAGCDSVLTLNLTINQPSTSSETVTSCGSYQWQGQTFTASGTYMDTLVNAANCDSVLTLNLTINQPTTSSETITSCGSFQWQGQTYTASGIYQDTLTNAANCDSILTLNLTINQPTSSTETITSCGSYQWQGQTYTASGTYQDTLQNTAGCDSILTLNLTINQVTTSLESITACGSYQWQGQVLTASGTYQDTLVNSANCDSIAILMLTINQPTTSSETVTACSSYQWQGQTYTASGTYLDTLVNNANCDSILTLILTVINLDSSITVTGDTLTANQPGATYQWIDCSDGSPIPGATTPSFIPSQSGSYAVAIGANGCTVQSPCETVVIVGRENPQLPKLELYPNPSQGEIILRVPEWQDPAEITIYDLQGKQIHQQAMQSPEQKLNLGHLARGSYLLRFRSMGRVLSRKIQIL